MKRLLLKTDKLITISQELTDCFGTEFHNNPITLMTGTNYKISSFPSEFPNVTTINYFGNISCGRYKTIYQIGRALDSINKKHGTNILLNVYSPEKDVEAQKMFKETDSIVFKGFVFGEEFRNLLFNSQLLLHVESFDEADIDRVRHSVSTKIADSLALGIVLFSCGPDSVSSIKHLQRNGYPPVAIEKDSVYSKLETVIFDGDYRKECACIGIAIANKFHNSILNSKAFYDYIKAKTNENRF